jgi:hypothetical protein
VVNAIARGHRWGTHDAVLGPLAFGLLAYAAAWHRWSALLLLALAIGLALRALHVVIPGRAEETIIGNLLLSWGGAWLLLEHSPSPEWLPLAVVIGVLTHIAGDGLTKEGVPVPLVWLVRRSRVHPVHLHTGAFIERAVLVPLFVLATVAFLYANTDARDLVEPLLAQIG